MADRLDLQESAVHNWIIDYIAIPTLEVKSPFSYEYFVLDNNYGKPFPKEEKGLIGCISDRSSSFNSYDVYTFISRMNVFLRDELSPSLSCNLVQKRDGKMVNLYVELHDGGDFYPITKDNIKMVEDIVEKSKENSEHFLLFKPTRDIYYKGVCISMNWMISVLRCIEVPDKLNYFVGHEELKPYYYNNGIYIKLNPYVAYDRFKNEIYFVILDQILDLYIKGCIVLNYKEDVEMIRNWDLIQVNMLDDKDYRLYKCRWTNCILTKSPSEFLLERLMGEEWIRVDVIDVLNINGDGENERKVKHNIATGLIENNIVFKFCDKWLMFIANNIRDANIVTRIMMRSKNIAPSGTVEYEEVNKGMITSIY